MGEPAFLSPCHHAPLGYRPDSKRVSHGDGVSASAGADQYNAANADLITQLELLAEMEQPSVVNVL